VVQGLAVQTFRGATADEAALRLFRGRLQALAEAQAKKLAAVLAKLGRAVQVRILDRGRNLVGTQLYPAVA